LDVVASQQPDWAPSQVRMRGGSDMSPGAVIHRLDCHQRDIRQALLKGGKWARKIEATLSDRERGEDPHVHDTRAHSAVEAAKEFRPVREVRALGTGGGATATAPGQASAFVSPAFVMKLYAAYRGVGRPFASQCRQMPIPDYGMRVYIPY